MSQTETGKATAADERTEAARSFVRTVKAATRRKYTPEEKIRIVLEGFRREVTVSDLCRREGIKPHSYYSWTKEFMEAGKERLTRDSVRDATREEVHQLKRENGELKQLVADLSLEVYRLKKRPYQCLRPPAVSADEWRREGGGAYAEAQRQGVQVIGPLTWRKGKKPSRRLWVKARPAALERAGRRRRNCGKAGRLEE